MIYYIENGKLKENGAELDPKEFEFRPCLAVLSQAELEEKRTVLEIDERISSEDSVRQTCRFESHDGFDSITVSIPNREHLEDGYDNLILYFRLNLLVFAYQQEQCGERLNILLSEVTGKGIQTLSLERILYEFFDQLTAGDALSMEAMEQRIFEMEESLMTDHEDDYIQKILELRRQLLVLKRYYEQLLDVSEAIEENENGLLGKKTVRAFGNLTGRIDRLSDGVINLRDYVSQVREAYQAQVDISQNRVMKLFTVITAIFLPLNLIAAWYGMNLRMPEFHLAFFYPVVIAVSVTVVVVCFWYFKRHKWF